jgi:hypothetical protein
MFRANDNKRSLGKRRSAKGTKNDQPADFIGSVVVERPTLEAIIKHLAASASEEIVCNVKGWDYGSKRTACLHLEISRPRETTVRSCKLEESPKHRRMRHRY